MLDRLTSTAEARRDSALAVVIILFAALLYWEAFKLPPPFFDPLGSAAVPKFVACVLVVLALMLIGQQLLKKSTASGTPEEDAVRPMPLVAVGSVLAVVGYALLLQYDLLSFRTASIVFVFVLGSILARFSWRVMRWILPIAVLLGFAFNFIFTQVFYIDLPQDSLLQNWLWDEPSPAEGAENAG
ncbi:MAG: tripartite tricarboxylate transporter TctB family protein [Pseudomonadota bacterium]